MNDTRKISDVLRVQHGSAQTSGVFNSAKMLMERLNMQGEEEGSDYEGEAEEMKKVQNMAEDESNDD